MAEYLEIAHYTLSNYRNQRDIWEDLDLSDDFVDELHEDLDNYLNSDD